MQQIRIDFDNPGLPQSLGVVEGESQSRIFQAALYKSGAAYTAPAGAVYSIMYRGFGPQNQGWYDTIEDGAGKRAACTVSGNVVTCELARQALRVPGHLTVVLCVSDAKGYMLKSWPIMADVRNDGYEDTGEIEMYFNLSGLAGNYLTQLEKAMADAEATKNNLISISTQAQKDIDAKAAAALESIPEEYTELDGNVKQLKEDINGFEFYRLNYINGDFTENEFINVNASGDIRKINSAGLNYAISPVVKIKPDSTIYVRGIYASQSRIAVADENFSVTRIIEANENTSDKLGTSYGFYNTFNSTASEQYIRISTRATTSEATPVKAEKICMVGIDNDIPQAFVPYNKLYKDTHELISDTIYLSDFSISGMYNMLDNMGTSSKKLIVRNGETLKLNRYVNINSNTEICGGGIIDLTDISLNKLWNPSAIANVKGATSIFIHDLTFIYSHTESASLFRFAYASNIRIENCKFIVTGNYLNAVIDLHKGNSFIAIKNNTAIIKMTNAIHGGFLWVQNESNEGEPELASSNNIIVENNTIESTGGDEIIAIYSTHHATSVIKNVIIENNKFVRPKDASNGFIVTIFANPNRTLQSIAINNNIFEVYNKPTTHLEILRIGAANYIGGVVGLSITNNVFECNEASVLPIFFYPGYNSFYNTLIQYNVYNNAENCEYSISLYGVRATVAFNSLGGKALYQQGQNAISVKNIFNNVVEN